MIKVPAVSQYRDTPIAHGAIVDEQTMIDALESGHMRHAGPDVFNIELAIAKYS